jgi:hypothetical protein
MWRRLGRSIEQAAPLRAASAIVRGVDVPLPQAMDRALRVAAPAVARRVRADAGFSCRVASHERVRRASPGAARDVALREACGARLRIHARCSILGLGADGRARRTGAPHGVGSSKKTFKRKQ